jgi:hypothetical protein
VPYDRSSEAQACSLIVHQVLQHRLGVDPGALHLSLRIERIDHVPRGHCAAVKLEREPTKLLVIADQQVGKRHGAAELNQLIAAALWPHGGVTESTIAAGGAQPQSVLAQHAERSHRHGRIQ